MKQVLLAFSFILTICQAFANPLWMRYPAISPNGEQIVFSYQDDLWLVDSKGGKAEALTRHEAHDYKPVWSNDGSKIAFASNRFGNFDVFLLDLKSRQISRLTKYSSNDFPSDFSNDDKRVLFSSARVDHHKNAQFPYRRLGELYEISIDGAQLKMISSIAAESAIYSKDGSFIIYQNAKGYEDEWRKHHTSSVTRDIVKYDLKSKTYARVTEFEGEDRNPIPAKDNKGFYFLRDAVTDKDKQSCYNVFYKSFDGSTTKQITEFSQNPVRFLSMADNGLLCFGFRGEVYTMNSNGDFLKVEIDIAPDLKENDSKFKMMNSGATEYAVSPNGKEIAFVIRGDVFVTSVDHNTTKTITSTPWQERSISFSPNGKAILYAAEKGTSWSVYQTKLVNEEESYFYNSTVLEEETVIETKAECFQPKFSPNGEEVAFLEERTTLRVINLASQKTRTILSGSYNYSYSDGDQWYDWSPDGKWFAVDFNDPNRWMGEVGIIASDGKGELINLTQSGYGDGGASFMANGNVIIYQSDRYGMRSHGSWGAESDVFGVFLNKEFYDNFKKPLSEIEAEEKTEKSDKGDAKENSKDKEEEFEPIKIDFEGIEDRKVRLSLHSARLGGSALSKDARKLYYLARYEKGTDLWEYDIKKRSAKSLTKFESGAYGLNISKDGKTAYVMSGGRLHKVDLAKGSKKPITFNAKLTTDYTAERAYLFEHMWRQVQKKFYVEDLHGVDWDYYKKEYSRFLPHINNNQDFAEMMSELLGELNASHTGCRFRNRWNHADNTASLGFFIDYTHNGTGVKIAEIMPKSPLQVGEEHIYAGNVITHINGEAIESVIDFHSKLNHKAAEKIQITYQNDKGKTSEKYVVPISLGQEYSLLYKRWVSNCRDKALTLSEGKVGYVHVAGMDDGSFRQVYEDLLGKHSGMEAVIVDTRFNGGGWLHDDLATLLDGKRYVDFVPRGQFIGSDPHEKWNKPSCVLAGEGNYSDAHAFPWVYQTLGIGPVIGMPVPGTMTAVWWENQIDNTLVFGIPQVGAKDMDGNYLENQELQPDIKVNNEPGDLLNNKDTQIEEAVSYLLEQIKK
ncbi:MAG: PD40 domain-containing protein [Bacteroidia bacterium]